jgi:TonB family protein
VPTLVFRFPSPRSRPLAILGAAVATALAVALAAAPARAQDYPIEPFPEPKQAPPAAPKLTKAPQLLKATEPVYPPEAFAAGLKADVTMMIDLDADGKVTKVEVTQAAGHGFDEAAVEAVKASTFSPAEVDGKPSPIRFAYTLHFVPKVVPAAPPPEPEPPPPEPPPPPPPPPTVVAVGRVREKGTRNPLSDADVAVAVKAPDGTSAPARVVTTTDPDGHFQIHGDPGVPLRVIIADPAHEPCVRDIDGAILRADHPAEIDCMVPRRGGPSYEARVTAPRETQSATRYTLTQPELTTVPGTFGDPLRVVQNLPGVARSPFGLGLLVVRGSSPQDSGVFVEGHQIPIIYHFLGGPSVLTPRLIDRVDFFPGNFGVQYGRFSAGIIDVGVKSDPTPRLHGNVDINFLDSSAYVEGPVGGGWTGAVSARRSYIDILLAATLPSSTATVAPVYYDYQAGVHRDIAGGRLAFFAFGSDDQLKIISHNPQANISLDTETGFHRLFAIWTRNFNGWKNVLSPAIGYDRLVFGAGALALNESAYIGELRDELSKVFSEKFTWRVGFDGQVRQDSAYYDLPLDPMTRLYGPVMPMFQQGTFPLDRLGIGLFTDATWNVGRGVQLLPGLRSDYFRYVGQDRFTFDPRIVIRWRQNPDQLWKAGAGIFHQMPQPQVLNPTYGNPNLPPIYATQYSVGLERRILHRLSLDATAYLVYRYDEPVPVPGMPPFTPTGEQRSYGLELILKHEFTERFYGWLAYTLSRSEETATPVGGPTTASPDMSLTSTSPTWSPTAFDQTHNLILVASYKLNAWRFGTRFRVVTGSPTTAQEEGYYDADTGQYVCKQAPANGLREPTFNQLDVRIERTWTFNAWSFSGYLDVQNVYNALNPEATVYDYRCRDSAAVRGIPILPVLGVRGLF